jgi:hypothetical protein
MVRPGSNAGFGKVRDSIARRLPVTSGRLGHRADGDRPDFVLHSQGFRASTPLANGNSRAVPLKRIVAVPTPRSGRLLPLEVRFCSARGREPQ